MAKKRRPLHEILCEVLDAPFDDGEDHCYFQPPASIQMKYPCIRYSYADDMDEFADNRHYIHSKRYIITVLDCNPDSKIPDRLRELPYCYSDRNYAMDGLNHFVFTLFYSGPRVKEEDDNVQNQMGPDRRKILQNRR